MNRLATIGESGGTNGYSFNLEAALTIVCEVCVVKADSMSENVHVSAGCISYW